MKIKTIVSRHRRDFSAIYECQSCGHVTPEPRNGYDDAYFHKEVIPAMKCPECGKTAGEDYAPLATKYDESVVI